MNILSDRVLRLALGSMSLLMGLNAGMASALDFNFTFTGTGTPTSPATVSGLITGLVDNLPDQKNVTISITSATNSPGLGWPTFRASDWFDGDGFDVSNGEITGVDVNYISGDEYLYLGNQGQYALQLTDFDVDNQDNNSEVNSLVFTPVPGPLPIIGAAVALRTTRQLRRRCKAAA